MIDRYSTNNSRAEQMANDTINGLFDGSASVEDLKVLIGQLGINEDVVKAKFAEVLRTTKNSVDQMNVDTEAAMEFDRLDPELQGELRGTRDKYRLLSISNEDLEELTGRLGDRRDLKDYSFSFYGSEDMVFRTLEVAKYTEDHSVREVCSFSFQRHEDGLVTINRQDYGFQEALKEEEVSKEEFLMLAAIVDEELKHM